MSTQDSITLTPLAGGLRLISHKLSGEELDVNSGFIAEITNIERIIKPLLISNDSGYVVEIEDCTWKEKLGYTGTPALAPNQIHIVVRGHPNTPGPNGYPHTLLDPYDDLSGVTFEIVAVVH